MFGRLIGFLMLLVGVLGLVLSVAGLIYGRRLVDSIGESLENNLSLTSQSLDNVVETLVLARATLKDVNAGMLTVENTAGEVAQTITQTRPLLEQISAVASQDAPESIEAVQAAMPQLIEVAGAIDSTLSTLDRFAIDESFLGIPLRFDLGINYDPEVPFDQSVREIGQSLDGLPGRLRSLDVYIGVTSNNLQTIGQGVSAISEDLSAVNKRLAESEPLLDEYVRIAVETNDNIRQTRAGLAADIAQARLIVTIVMAWLGLMQLVPLYLGYELLAGRRRVAAVPVAEPLPVSVPVADDDA